MARHLYLLILLTTFVLGVIQFSTLIGFEQGKRKLKFKRNNKYLQIIKDSLKEEVEIANNIFTDNGIKITGQQYQAIRFSVIATLFIIWTLQLIMGSIGFSLVIWAIIFYLASIPRLEIAEVKTPFSYLLHLYNAEFQKKKDLEVYNIVSQVKNICLTMKGDVGVDYIIEEILNFAKYTKPIFLKFASLWNVNKKDEAVNYLAGAMGSEIGKELAYLLYKFDDLDGIELIDQLNIYQNSVREEKKSIRTKAQERKTTVFYTLTVAVMILIIGNMLVTIIFGSMIDTFNFIL